VADIFSPSTMFQYEVEDCLNCTIFDNEKKYINESVKFYG